MNSDYDQLLLLRCTRSRRRRVNTGCLAINLRLFAICDKRSEAFPSIESNFSNSLFSIFNTKIFYCKGCGPLGTTKSFQAHQFLFLFLSTKKEKEKKNRRFTAVCGIKWTAAKKYFLFLSSRCDSKTAHIYNIYYIFAVLLSIIIPAEYIYIMIKY